MLMRLKRVDVYDNCVTYTPASYDSTAYGVDSSDDPSVLSSWKFLSNFLDMRREKSSQIHMCHKKNEVYKPVVSSRREEGSNKALVILAKTALYDTLHHCDVCKFYREGIASAVSQVYDYQLNTIGENEETVDLKIVVPPIHCKYFDIDEEKKSVIHLILPSTSQTMYGHTHMVKSPVLMMSTVGEEEGKCSSLKIIFYLNKLNSQDFYAPHYYWLIKQLRAALWTGTFSRHLRTSQ